MAKNTMSKILALNSDTINENVKDQKIGNYYLGYKETFTKKKGRTETKYYRFVVGYVGRSDTDLKIEIKKQGLQNKVKKSGKPIYTHFKFTYNSTVTAAYKFESKSYHKFGASEKLDNKRHPKRPNGFTKETLPCRKPSCKY